MIYTINAIQSNTTETTVEQGERFQYLTEFIDKKTARKIQTYIEAHLDKWRSAKRPLSRFASKKCPRSVQYDPELDTVFVWFNREKEGDKLVGEGAYKKTKLAMDYFTGEILARSTSADKMDEEIQNLTLLNGKSGIVQTIGIYQYVNKYGVKKTATIQKLMDRSLKQFLEENPPPEQRNWVALDILTGLKNMHANGLTHNDLHLGNILVSNDPKTHKPQSVIIDFGHSSPHMHLAKWDVCQTGDILLHLYKNQDIPYDLFDLINLMLDKKISAQEAHSRFCEIFNFESN